jgi:predicted small lipoprotein YifL
VNPRFTHFAVIGALAVAFTLAGCGRKGPLDLPPSAGATPPAPAAAPSIGFSPATERETPTTPSSFNAQGKPVAPSNAPKRPLPMDWLID